MVGSINKVILVGNVGKEPEFKTLPSGGTMASLVLATSESWIDKPSGERREKTEWHRIAVFVEGLVNIIKNYVHKGSKLYVEGAIHTRKWMDASGVEKYSTEIVLQGYNSTLTILDSKKVGNDNGSQSSSSEFDNGGFSDSRIDDDLPF